MGSKSGLPTVFSPRARHWAVKELARRAGVTREQFTTWRIDCDFDTTCIWIDSVRGKRIRIRADDSQILCRSISDLSTNFAEWMRSPGEVIEREIPRFVIPYSPFPIRGKRPLFRLADCDTVESGFDILTTTLLCLGRAEEIAAEENERDQHGRFKAAASVAVAGGFLDRPIIDEYGLALAQAIESLIPGWKQQTRQFTVKLSHDIDDLDIPFVGRPEHLRNATTMVRVAWLTLPVSIRTAIQETTRKHRPLSTLKSLGEIVAGKRQSAFQLVRELVALSRELGLDSAFYWKASRLTPYDSGYDPCAPKVNSLIREVSEQGFENGVHPGYYTFHNGTELDREISRLRQAIKAHELGGRQHYLRWSPLTWNHWERNGLCYDSSLTYAETPGFRAGTCIPYKPWLLCDDREARLLEIPLIIMEDTLTEYMGESRHEVLSQVIDFYIQRCRSVGGTFTFLCHNTTLLDGELRKFYTSELQKFSGTPKFDWQRAMGERWSEENWTVSNLPSAKAD
jgi:hypothetical protein